MAPAIDGGHLAPELELDSRCRVPLRAGEEEPRDRRSGEERRQANAVIRRHGLIANDDDAHCAGCTPLRELPAETPARHPISDDDQRSCSAARLMAPPLEHLCSRMRSHCVPMPRCRELAFDWTISASNHVAAVYRGCTRSRAARKIRPGKMLQLLCEED